MITCWLPQTPQLPNQWTNNNSNIIITIVLLEWSWRWRIALSRRLFYGFIYIYIYIYIFATATSSFLFAWGQITQIKLRLKLFKETLFFLYQINKQIIINHKEVGVPSFCQVFIFFFFLTPSIRYYSFKKNYVEQTHAAMPKESLAIGQNTPITKYIYIYIYIHIKLKSNQEWDFLGSYLECSQSFSTLVF